MSLSEEPIGPAGLLISRHHMAMLAGLAVIVLTAYLFTLRPGLGWTGDAYAYIQHAANLASGDDYLKTGYVYNPDAAFIGPPGYPPVYPALLAPLYVAFDGNIMRLKLVVVFSFVLLLPVLWFLARLRFGPKVAFGITLLFGSNPYFWDIKDNVMSDIPFTLFLAASLLMAELAGSRSGRSWSFPAAAAGVLAVLAIGTRTLGLAIPLAVLATWLAGRIWISRRRLDGQTAAIVLIIVVIGMTVLRLMFPSPGGYASLFNLHPGHIAYSLVTYGWATTALWPFPWLPAVSGVMACVAGFLVVVGFVEAFRSRGGATEWLVLIYVAVLAIWPLRQGTRFLIPMLPLYYLYLWFGWLRIRDALEIKKQIQWIVPFALVAFIGFNATYLSALTSPAVDGPTEPTSESAFSWIMENLDEEDVVLMGRPRVLSYLTGRSAVAFASDASDQDLTSLIEAYSVDLIMASKKSDAEWAGLARNTEKLLPWVREHAERLELVFSNDVYDLYRVR